MRTNYRTLLYSAAFCMMAGFSSCSDETDLSGSLQEIQTISSITLDQTVYNADVQNLYMLPNQEIQLGCTVLPEEANDKSVKWTSQNETVAVVSADGYLVTKNVGTTVVRVTPGIGFGPSATTPSFTVNVVDHFNYIEGITLKNTDVLATEGLAESASYQVEVEALPATATFKRYKWESLNTEIATVDEKSGLVTGVKAGTATIKVTADDFSASPVSATFTVKVTPTVKVEGIDFTDEGKAYLAALGYGETYNMKNAVKLTPADATYALISWSSDNESAVSVDAATGVLKVNGLTGTANITATCGGVTATIPVSIAGGRLWYSFESQIAPWIATDEATLSTDGEKLKLTLDATGDGSISFDGNLPLSMDYPILAMKMRLPYKVLPGDNKQGVIFIDTQYGRYYQSSNNGNNKFTVVEGYESQYDGNLPTTPMVCYFDWANGFGTKDKLHNLPANGTEEISKFKIRTVDFNKVEGHLGYTDIYWIRSFKSVDELKAYLAEIESNNY